MNHLCLYLQKRAQRERLGGWLAGVGEKLNEVK